MNGVDNVTVSPAHLRELATMDASTWKGQLGSYFAEGPSNKSWQGRDLAGLVRDEGRWKFSFARSGSGASESRTVQAVNYFADFQDKLELLFRGLVSQ